MEQFGCRAGSDHFTYGPAYRPRRARGSAAEAEVPAPEAAPKATSRPAARQRQEAPASEYEYIASMTDEDLDEVVSMIQADPFLLAAGDYYSDPLSE